VILVGASILVSTQVGAPILVSRRHSGVPVVSTAVDFFLNSGVLTRAVWWRLALALLYQSLPLLRGKLWLCLSRLRTKVWLKSRGWSSALLGPLGDGFDSTKNVASSASWSDSDTGWPSGVTAMSSGIEKSSTLTLRWFCARYMR